MLLESKLLSSTLMFSLGWQEYLLRDALTPLVLMTFRAGRPWGTESVEDYVASRLLSSWAWFE